MARVCEIGELLGLRGMARGEFCFPRRGLVIAGAVCIFGCSMMSCRAFVVIGGLAVVLLGVLRHGALGESGRKDAFVRGNERRTRARQFVMSGGSSPSAVARSIWCSCS